MTAKADLDAMLQDFEEDQAERGGGVAFFKVPAGKSYVRLLPPHENAAGRAVVKGGVHWVNGRSYSCPVAFRETATCWFCDRAQELFDAGSEADRKEASTLSVTTRFYANVIQPNETDPDPQVWEFGRSVYDQVMRYMGDPDYGDVTDPDEGYDLIVEREGAGLKTKYHIRARKNPSALSDDVLRRLEEEPETLRDLRNLRPFLTGEEMQAAYEGENGTYTDFADEEEEVAPRSKHVDEEDDEEEAPTRTVRTSRPAPRPGRPIGSSGTTVAKSTRQVVDEVLKSRGRR